VDCWPVWQLQPSHGPGIRGSARRRPAKGQSDAQSRGSLTSDDAKSVCDALKKEKVQGCVCFELRYSSQFQMTRSVVQQGLLGELHYSEVDYYHGIGP